MTCGKLNVAILQFSISKRLSIENMNDTVLAYSRNQTGTEGTYHLKKTLLEFPGILGLLEKYCSLKFQNTFLYSSTIENFKDEKSEFLEIPHGFLLISPLISAPFLIIYGNSISSISPSFFFKQSCNKTYLVLVT